MRNENKMMKSFYVMFLSGMLCACAPYVDSRREAGLPYLVGQSTKDVVAICYHPWTTDTKELLQIANLACENKNHDAKRTDTTYFNCTLTTPHTAFYSCR